MWSYYLTNVLSLLRETWQILVIGFATASLAFLVGWTASRRRQAKEAARAEGADPFTSGGSNERRNALRRGGHPISVEMNDPDAKLPQQLGYVVDRSVGGLCLMTPNAIPVGSVWKVRPCNAPRTTLAVQVEVKSCTAVENEWKLGCQFARTPSYAVLLMFG